MEENGFTRIEECYGWVGNVSGSAVNGKKKTLRNNILISATVALIRMQQLNELTAKRGDAKNLHCCYQLFIILKNDTS